MMREAQMDWPQALDYLSSLAVFGIRPGLSRTRRLLELLGSPQEQYRCIHVAGTNGKGSVASMLAGILSAAALRTGLYTSPHLVSYRERLRMDGSPIPEGDFAACLGRIRPLAGQVVAEGMEPPTQFEALTAAALDWFRRQRAEYAVVEAGLGGLLDSTNVIRPVLSIITNVTMEHADRCGGTLEGIARHKAGIIKEGVPVLTAARGMPLDIIRAVAREKHAPLFVEGEDFHAELLSRNGGCQRMVFCGSPKKEHGIPYELSLLGAYQRENSALALMAAQLLQQQDSRIAPEGAAAALAHAAWPARFERLELPCPNGEGRQTVLVDGAHNPAGMAALRQSLDLAFPAEGRVLLLGILRDKDIRSMLRELLRPEDIVLLSTPASCRAAAPELVAREARQLSRHVEELPDQRQALERALALAAGRRILVAAGSLYLVGGLRELLLERV